MRQSHRERGSDLSEHLLNAVLLVLVPLRRLRSLARERKRMCVLAWPLRCLFPSPLVLVPACGVCALQGVTVSREALCVTVCIQKHSRWKQILMLAPVSRNTPPLGCRIFRGERLAPNTALLVLSQSVVRVPPLALQRETRSLWSALAPARWHKRRREETPKRPCEDTQALPFSGKEKRRDLAFQDAEWRTWTLQSANCCVKTKLVSVQKQWRSKRNSKTRAKTVNFNLKLPSVEKEVTSRNQLMVI